MLTGEAGARTECPTEMRDHHGLRRVEEPRRRSQQTGGGPGYGTEGGTRDVRGGV